MAQVLDHYKGTVTGGVTIYYYEKPDSSSRAVRILSGTQVKLPLSFRMEKQNGFVPLLSPEGWMYEYNLTDFELGTVTVPDVCIAPESVTLDAQTGTLTITGGYGIGENEMIGRGLSWRERAINGTEWTEWTADTVVNAPTVSVTVNSGMVRQFRVRILGVLGEAYHSSYTLCPDLLVGNNPACVPVVLLPEDGAVTRCMIPRVILYCSPDPDGDTMTLQRSVDGGNWSRALSVAAAGGRLVDRLPVLANGDHTIAYRLLDANGGLSGEVSLNLTVQTHTWARAVTAGAVIASRDVSHQEEMQGLVTAVNQQRTYYGLPPMQLPGEIGRFADWQSQLQAMQAAVNESRAVAAQTAYAFAEVPVYPLGTVETQIRAQTATI